MLEEIEVFLHMCVFIVYGHVDILVLLMDKGIGVNSIDEHSVFDILGDIVNPCSEGDQLHLELMLLIVLESQVVLGHTFPIEVIGSSLGEFHTDCDVLIIKDVLYGEVDFYLGKYAFL